MSDNKGTIPNYNLYKSDLSSMSFPAIDYSSIVRNIKPPPIEINEENTFAYQMQKQTDQIIEKSNEQIQVNENIYNEDKKDGINCVLRNTFTNVKIYPTTYLNNKIIYQKVEKNSDENNNENIERNQGDNNKNENNSNDLRRSNSKIKKKKIVIDISDKNINKINNEYNFQSIEEIHYFFVDTLQKGKKFAIKLDKYNN